MAVTVESSVSSRLPPDPFEDGIETPLRPSATAIALAVVSLGAAALHFAFAPGHFEESTAHGTFFIVIGWAQLLSAVLLLVRPTRSVVIGTLLLNLGVIVVWGLSRTVGVPIGPNAGEVEAVGVPDSIATALEAILVFAMAGRLLGVRSDLSRRVSWFAPAMSIATVVLVVGGTSAALTPRFAGEHHHGGTEAAAGTGGEATHSHGTTDGSAAATGTGATGATTDPAAHDHGTAAVGLTGDTPCELSGPPASTAQTTDAEGHDHRGPLPQQPVSEADRQLLQQQQVIARTVADKYPTVAAAEAAGYSMSTVYVPCIGAHYTNQSLVFSFDPANPSELLYDGTAPDAKIVGLSFLMYHPGGAPDGFAGPNDVWHQHNFNGGLCFGADGTVVGGETTSEADCAARGGHKAELTDIWMVHDWIVPGWECGWGVFAAECPELGGTAGGSAFSS